MTLLSCRHKSRYNSHSIFFLSRTFPLRETLTGSSCSSERNVSYTSPKRVTEVGTGHVCRMSQQMNAWIQDSFIFSYQDLNFLGTQFPLEPPLLYPLQIENHVVPVLTHRLSRLLASCMGVTRMLQSAGSLLVPVIFVALLIISVSIFL